MKICGTGDTVTSRSDTLMEKRDENDETIMTRTTTISAKSNKMISQVESKEERFLSLLRTDPEINEFNKKNITKNKNLVKYTTATGKNSAPEDNLLSSEPVLFSYLASFDQTQPFEEIMRYLFYIYTGNSYGITDDKIFNKYEPDDFKSLNNTGSVSYESISITDEEFEILCKITSAERGNGNQQQQEYVVSVILNRVLCSSFPNNIRDVVFAPGQFQPIRNGQYERANPSEITKNAVKNVINNGDTTGGALYFCTPSAAAKDPWWSTIIYLFNDNNDAASSHNFYTTEQGKIELAQYQKFSGGTVLQEAILAHQYVEENGYSYAQIGLTIPDGVLSGKTIDCSSFVSWVLYRAGFTNEFTGHQKVASTFLANPWGWETISSINEAVAGDILVYSGHVEIYAGEITSNNKAKVYNCGGNTSVKNPAPSTSGYYTSEIKRIIRAPG